MAAWYSCYFMHGNFAGSVVRSMLLMYLPHVAYVYGSGGGQGRCSDTFSIGQVVFLTTIQVVTERQMDRQIDDSSMSIADKNQLKC